MRLKNEDLIAVADFLFAGYLIFAIGFCLDGVWKGIALHLLVGVVAFLISAICMLIKNILLLRGRVSDLEDEVYGS